MRSLGKPAQCALALIVGGYSLGATPAQTATQIYRCTLGDLTTFSDRPCQPAAVPYEPDASRISTYKPPPASPAAGPAARPKPPRRGSSIAQDQVRHAAECARVRDALKDVAARMRSGYNANQGEQLRARKAKLEARRRAQRCR
jgi:hypothetical protein